MFKKKCTRCKTKIKRGYDFCPSCGNNLKSDHDREDYGILGKNDMIEEGIPIFGGETVMDKMFEGAFKMAEKMLEKQMKNFSEEMQNQAKTMNQRGIPPGMDVQFFVNGKRVFSNQAQGPGNQKIRKQQPIKIENTITEEKAKTIATLPKKEAVSKVRRLSGKIIFELEVPGVKDISDVLINQLENSIEVKAISEKQVYHKTLNINLPILKYGLTEGNLILELQARG
jgi:hypothetical protein